MKKPLGDDETQKTLLESMRATFVGLVSDHDPVRGSFTIIPLVKTPDGMVSLVEVRFVVAEKKLRILQPDGGGSLPGENLFKRLGGKNFG